LIGRLFVDARAQTQCLALKRCSAPIELSKQALSAAFVLKRRVSRRQLSAQHRQVVIIPERVRQCMQFLNQRLDRAG
jgi:hypothetical protein